MDAGRALGPLWAALFPARCLGCGRRGVALCERCTAGLPFLPATVCPRCASPRPAAAACRACAHLPAALATVRAVCAYEDVARKAVHTLKFRSGRYLAPTLGLLLRQAAERRPLRVDLVVPVPLSAARRRERGYNQAELLAREIVGPVGGELAPTLLARLERAPQQRLSAPERRRNLRGAVTCVAPELVVARRVLLVDDVMTTGATLGACAEALAGAGALWVGALVFARDL